MLRNIIRSSRRHLECARWIGSRRGMAYVVVRSAKDEERMQLKFTWINPTNGKDRLFNFDRPKVEDIGLTLARMTTNISKFANKKNKKNDAGEIITPVNIPVNLLVNGEKCEYVENEKAWIKGAVFEVADTKYDVIVNPPEVHKIKLPSCVMVGFPVRAQIECEFTDLPSSRLSWYVAPPDSGETQAQKKLKLEESEWVEAGEGLSFTPSANHAHCLLKLRCTPSDGSIVGTPLDSETVLISHGPYDCPFEKRQAAHTSDFVADDRLRVMSYNILADLYADSDFSRDYLFPYCPTEVLAYDYRKQLLTKEIPGYKADIVCLQECDLKMFTSVLQPTLEGQGYQGQVKVKPGEMPEGCAMFYRTSKFRLVADHSLDSLMETFQQDDLHSDLLAKVMTLGEEERDKFLKRKTNLQVAALEHVSDSSKLLLVANTHFYFHPRANHIRLIQTIIALRHLEQLVQQYKTKGREAAVVFCGDLNSSPLFGVYQLLTTGSIPANHADWWSEGKGGYIGDTELSHSLLLENACGLPQYTNYVTSFAGCLDYIFIDKTKLQTQAIIPLPSHQEITKHVALPNPQFPSDHLPIICELQWK